jgi:predicted metalloprotease
MRLRTLALTISVALVLAGCSASSVPGAGTVARVIAAPDVAASAVPINGAAGTSLEQQVRNSLTDIQQFWTKAYPLVSNGAPFKPLTGQIYSVTTGHPNTTEACMKAQATAADNNAFYCRLDDSFAFDRVGLVNVLTEHLGNDFVPLVFAHETGHLIQNRLGIERASILMESQADCASGAFMAAEAGDSPIKLTNRHYDINPTDLDKIAIGLILLRDYSPHASSVEGSHGDGFDRMSAFSDGFKNGVQFCYSSDWTQRQFTERAYSSTQDDQAGGNEPEADVVSPSGGLVGSLNSYWTSTFKTIGKTFKPVVVKQATTPTCSSNSSVKFGYCASDNTVYYDATYAQSVYNSLPAIAQGSTGTVVVDDHTVGDYTLGALFAYAWGMSVRSQLGFSTADTSALLGASCYVGSYSQSINVVATQENQFTLSPPDMDEATVTVLQTAGQSAAFGARNTTGFARIIAFKQGYFGGITGCNNI